MSGDGVLCGNRVTAWLCLLPLILGSAFLGGCGSSGQQGVKGVVTLDGKPLEKGNITFRPLSGTASPSAGATVVNGEFSIAPKGGLLPGKFGVEITASRPTGKKRLDHFSGQMVTAEEQFIPARYNSLTELEAVVGASGSNYFDFRLASKHE